MGAIFVPGAPGVVEPRGDGAGGYEFHLHAGPGAAAVSALNYGSGDARAPAQTVAWAGCPILGCTTPYFFDRYLG